VAVRVVPLYCYLLLRVLQRSHTIGVQYRTEELEVTGVGNIVTFEMRVSDFWLSNRHEQCDDRAYSHTRIRQSSQASHDASLPLLPVSLAPLHSSRLHHTARLARATLPGCVLNTSYFALGLLVQALLAPDFIVLCPLRVIVPLGRS
jgi:hypothetical protein